MAYLDGYKWDIFLSYAHGDNKLPGSRAKWVSTFRDNLANEIEGQLGQSVEIHFDRRDLKRNQAIEKVLDNVRQSALFVAIGSPSYVNSDWCRREAAAFQELRRQDAMLIAERLPPRNDYPDSLPRLLLSKFWAEDEEKHSKQTFIPGTREYEDELIKLAGDIVACIEGFRDRGSGPTPPAQRSVYIAYCADDVGDKRRQLKDYLESASPPVRVLPEPFVRPGSTKRYLEAVKSGLDQAQIYVELLGQRPAEPIEDLDTGVTYHQHAEAALRPELERYSWYPETLKPQSIEDEEYRKLFEGKKVQAWGIAVFAQTIAAAAARAPAEPASPEGKPVFVISAKPVDEIYANDVFDACERRDYTVSDASLARPSQLRERFAGADTVTFIYGKAERRWLDAQYDIFQRARARHGAPLGPMPIIVCVGPPAEPGKRVPFHVKGLRKVDVSAEWSIKPFEHLLDHPEGP